VTDDYQVVKSDIVNMIALSNGTSRQTSSVEFAAMLAIWLAIVQIGNEERTGATTTVHLLADQRDVLEMPSTESTSLLCKSYRVEPLMQGPNSASKPVLDMMPMATRTVDQIFHPGNAELQVQQHLGQNHVKNGTLVPQHHGHLADEVAAIATAMDTSQTMARHLLHPLADQLHLGNRPFNHLLHLVAKAMVMATTLVITLLQDTPLLPECHRTMVVVVSHHRLLAMPLLQ
jgi:hypothetical protein